MQAIEAEGYAPISKCQTTTHHHGRQEVHKIWIAQDLEWLKISKEWDSLESLVCVQRTWEVKGEWKNQVRYYISSLSRKPQEFQQFVRRHLAIENEYHLHLDVTFKEYDTEIVARSNKILRVARTIAFQLLKAQSEDKLTIRRRKKTMSSFVFLP